MAYKTPEFKPETEVCFCGIELEYARPTTPKDYSPVASFNKRDGKYYWRKDNELVQLNKYNGIIEGLYWDTKKEEWVYTVAVKMPSVAEKIYVVKVPEDLITYDTDVLPEVPYHKYRDYLWKEEDRKLEKMKAEYEEEVLEVETVYNTFVDTLEGAWKNDR